jgi:peptide/nickel transport system ATP-binding protein
MYLGHIVEQGTTDQIFSPPYHPYTEALLSAIPIADTSVVKKHIVLEGDIPSAMNPPSGCPFQTRCRYKSQVPDGLCEREVPPVRDLGNGHQAKCHLADEILARMEPVISIAKDDDEESHGMPGAGPGFVGEPPRRPRGKVASPEAGSAGGSAEETQASARLRREDSREGHSETGAGLGDTEAPLQVGWGSQADDPDAASPFRPTIEELDEDEAERKDESKKH